MLIDQTYFKAEIYIGQLSSVEVSENLASFIEKYEAIYLKEVFQDLTVPDLSLNEDAKEAIAHFVYFYFVRNEYYQRAGIGETIPNSENSRVVIPRQRSVFAWNEMVRYTDLMIESLTELSLNNPFETINTFEI